jgi:hypothetical protein
MRVKLRHAAYLATMAILFPPRLILMGAAWANDQVNKLGVKMHLWAYRERYGNRRKL